MSTSSLRHFSIGEVDEVFAVGMDGEGVAFAFIKGSLPPIGEIA